MNRDQVEGKWHEMKGKLKAKWGKLTDDEIDQASGNLESLAGKIQQKYGMSREQAERELRQFQDAGSTVTKH